MKVLQFTIPVSKEHSIIVQEDVLAHFYNHLHRHNEIQITLVCKGRGTLIAGNHMKPFEPGNVYVIGSNQPHIFKSDPVYFRKRSAAKVHALTIFFDPGGMLNNFFELPEAKSIKKFIAQTPGGLMADKQHEQILAEKILAVKNSKQGFRIARFIELVQTMAGLRNWKKLSSVVPGSHYPDAEGLRMNDVYQFTLKHFNEPIKLDTIAGIACMTAPAFCRYFKKHTRKTYIGFLNEIRINEACKKILSGNDSPFSSIAYDTGFASAESFNRVFKQVTGKSPGQYRKEYGE